MTPRKKRKKNAQKFGVVMSVVAALNNVKRKQT